MDEAPLVVQETRRQTGNGVVAQDAVGAGAVGAMNGKAGSLALVALNLFLPSYSVSRAGTDASCWPEMAKGPFARSDLRRGGKG